MDELDRYDALGLAELVRRGEVTAPQLLDRAIARVEAVNPRINAVVLRHDELARRQLAEAAPNGPFAGVPFLLLTGWTFSVTVFIFATMGFGFFKGMYDANIWASLHDVVPPERRATAVGVMNCIGWLGGGVAPVAMASASGVWGMGMCLSATSAVYAVAGLLLVLGASRWMLRRLEVTHAA